MTLQDDKTQAQETPVDLFAQAFDELAKEGATSSELAKTEPAATEPAKTEPAKTEPAATEPAATEPAKTEPAADGTGSADQASIEGAQGSADQTAAKTEPEPAKGDSIDPLVDRFTKALETAVSKAKPAEPAQPEPTQAAPAPQEIPNPFAPEEVEFLKTFETEWPDVTRALALHAKAQLPALANYIFTETAKAIAPLVQAVQYLANEKQLGDLQREVTDYDSIRDEVVDWASKQPKYLQEAYNHVINNGTVDEVKDLITRFRQETGKAPASAQTQQTQQPAPTPTPQPKKDALPPAAKQAAAALAPVASKRSAVTQTDDPNDFEAAFAAFAKEQ